MTVILVCLLREQPYQVLEERCARTATARDEGVGGGPGAPRRPFPETMVPAMGLAPVSVTTDLMAIGSPKNPAEGNMSTIETSGLPTIEKEEYYITEDDIEGEEDRDEEESSAGGALNSDSESTFHLLLNLLLRGSCLGSNLCLLFSLLPTQATKPLLTNTLYRNRYTSCRWKNMRTYLARP